MTQRLAAGLILLLLFNSCKRSRLDVDISEVQIKEPELHRLDKDLFGIHSSNLKEKTAELSSHYGPFYTHYIINLLRVRSLEDSLYQKNLLAFLNDKDIKASQRSVMNVYSDEKIKELMPELNAAVKRFSVHFPKRALPKRYVTCLSGWNYAFAYTDSSLVTALDMYLGDTCVFYQMLQLPKYRTRFMNEYYILPDLVRGWMITEFDKSDATTTLLHHTIFHGKIYYAVNAMLPDIQDSILMAYTGRQMEYCRKYEKNLWGYFAEKNRLYENSLQTINELTADGPFTGVIHRDCPPRIAMWVGLQIVRSYMENNGKVTLEELMQEQDAQKILNKSRYRP